MKYRREAWRTTEHPSRMRRIIFPFPKAPQRGDRIIRLHYITRIGSVRLHCKTNQYSLWPRWPQLLPRRQAAAQPGRAPGHAGTPGSVLHTSAGTLGHGSLGSTGPHGTRGGERRPVFATHCPHMLHDFLNEFTLLSGYPGISFSPCRNILMPDCLFSVDN